MHQLINLDHFSALTNITKEELDSKLIHEYSGEKFIHPIDAINIFLQKIDNQLLAIDMNGNILEPIFLEKTIQTITFFYETLLKNKTEASTDIIQENQLLKNTLVSLQEECQTYQLQIQNLQKEVDKKNEEIEFLQRKYKLMWGKVSNIGGIKD
ncbi:hypothetical protein CQA57_02515 [Helicobacter anseris]|uniref:DUF3972 domain-containing protein n=1 Tax=Helicobacter anseris TaxID=375926 RepID=A0A3D8JA33_9HELI|nr:DUF3972 domain-containing protein [Helicobacter anseris]RDU74160.1 hypothetical protein CQA57_02515 [Helicobacter anseris]